MGHDDDLVGHFFHTFNDEGRLRFQGQILGSVVPGYYLCQLFSAFTGEPSSRRIRHVAEMAEWALYSSEEQSHSAAQNLQVGG